VLAAETLRDLRAVKDRLPVARLIQEAMAPDGYDAMLLAVSRRAETRESAKLVERARSFDRAGIFHAGRFIAQLFGVCRPAARRGLGRHSAGVERRRKVDVDPSVEGVGVSVVVVPDVGRPRRVAGPPIGFSPELGTGC